MWLVRRIGRGVRIKRPVGDGSVGVGGWWVWDCCVVYSALRLLEDPWTVILDVMNCVLGSKALNTGGGPDIFDVQDRNKRKWTARYYCCVIVIASCMSRNCEIEAY